MNTDGKKTVKTIGSHFNRVCLVLTLISPGYDIKLDPAVLPLVTSFGGLVAGRASGRKNSCY